MNELQAIVEAIDAADEQLYLATVVDVVGSSYRRPGARMLILPDGEHVGTISGGCLERDLCRAAAELTRHGPKLVSFDTRQDATNFNPRYNTGCSGIIYVLVEQVTRDTHCPAYPLRQVAKTNRPLVYATVYQTEGPGSVSTGRRYFHSAALLDACGHSSDHRPMSEIWNEVKTQGHAVCCDITSGGTQVRTLIERLMPPQSLWIFGAGDDAVPLHSMARQLGWRVTIADHRASRLSSERFPTADLICQPWDAMECRTQIPPDTAAVLMTHDFPADRTLIPWLLQTDARYVGVLGPKSRTGRLMKQLHADGRLPALNSLDRLHTPVGLDIGAVTPGEIAVAVLGEIIASGHDRTGGRLHSRNAPIHDVVRHELIELTPAADAQCGKRRRSQIALSTESSAS